jgi:hypothetical protein
VRWLLVALLTLTACGPSRGPDRPTEEDWRNARSVAEKWAVDFQGATAADIGDPVTSLPFLFQTTASSTGYVLVHKSGVWQDTGINALAQYLHDAGVYRFEALTRGELLIILRHFQALPPIGSRDGAPGEYYAGEGTLAPRFEWSGHQMNLTLFYLLKEKRGDNTMVAEWKITLGQGVQPKWHEDRRPYDGERFVE